MSKKDELLNKKTDNEYTLNEVEIIEVASLMALEEQAQAARNFMYSRILERIAERHGIADGTEVDLNWEEVMKEGAKTARLIVKS